MENILKNYNVCGAIANKFVTADRVYEFIKNNIDENATIKVLDGWSEAKRPDANITFKYKGIETGIYCAEGEGGKNKLPHRMRYLHLLTGVTEPNLAIVEMMSTIVGNYGGYVQDCDVSGYYYEVPKRNVT